MATIVCKPGVWPSHASTQPEPGNALRKIGPANHRVPVPTVTSRTEMLGSAAHPVPSKDEMSQFLKLKEEVVKRLQGYIQRHAKHITRSLTPDHEAVKCLVAFGENALKYAMQRCWPQSSGASNTGNCRSPSRCLTCRDGSRHRS